MHSNFHKNGLATLAFPRAQPAEEQKSVQLEDMQRTQTTEQGLTNFNIIGIPTTS